jgi:hypothetical protein
MSTVRFRYGFHPEGFDPLLALRVTQPATSVQGPSSRAIPRQDHTVPRTVVEAANRPAPGVPLVRPARVVRRERARRGSGWGKFLWASVVLLSAGVAGTVWASGEDSTTHPADTPVLAFAPPTIIEPEVVPADEPSRVAFTDVEPAPQLANVSSPASPKPPSAPQEPSPRTPSTTVPSQPSVSPVASPPPVTLPPAVVWTAPVEPPSSPPVSTPETPARRPNVVVRPEAKPTLKVPAAQSRTPVSTPVSKPASKPKTRPGLVTAGRMTRTTK